MSSHRMLTERSTDNDLVESFGEGGRKLDVRRGYWPSIFIRREKSAERREETILDIVWYKLWSVMTMMIAVSARRRNTEQN